MKEVVVFYGNPRVVIIGNCSDSRVFSLKSLILDLLHERSLSYEVIDIQNEFQIESCFAGDEVVFITSREGFREESFFRDCLRKGVVSLIIAFRDVNISDDIANFGEHVLVNSDKLDWKEKVLDQIVYFIEHGTISRG